MRRIVGEKISPIRLPGLDGHMFDTDTLNGKPFMLSFFRFASCPFCNLRVHQIVQRYNEFGDDFNMVAIFDSPLDNLVRHTAKHKAPFPILADGSNKYYRAYGIERSVIGMFKGMFGRMPTLFKSMFMGNIPLIFKGSMLTMPASFLVDRHGIIQITYYGKDEGDHLPLDEVMAFFVDDASKH